MTTRSSICYRHSGFTLLELLIALFIFSVVIGTVYGSYRTAFTNIRLSEQEAKVEEQANIILERLVNDLESVFSGEAGFLEGVREEVGEFRGDSLRFTSTAHLVFNRRHRQAGVTVIGYNLEEDGDLGLLNLYRTDQPGSADEEEEDEETGVLLGRNLLEFKLVYLDGEGSENDEWQSEGDNQGEGNEEEIVVLPAMVRITIRLARYADDGEGRLFRTAVAISSGNKQ